MSSEGALIWPWSELGLNEDERDARAVKRAYAKRLKSLDPEGDPQAFQRLRMAYEAARTIAASPSAKPIDVPPEEKFQPDTPKEAEPLETTHFVEKNDELFSDCTWANVEELSHEAQLRIVGEKFNVAEWEELLQHPALDLPDATEHIEKVIVEALMAREFPPHMTHKTFVDVPRNWAKVVDARFHWAADGLRFSRRFPYAEELRAAFRKRVMNEGLDDIKPNARAKPLESKRELPFFMRPAWAIFLYFLATTVLTALAA
nr:hypothetical protein [uncultured Celeribacter sp.]